VACDGMDLRHPEGKGLRQIAATSPSQRLLSEVFA
jgi:hypothetical protein